MKLQTMLLPTGEFAVIGSECKTLPPEAAREALQRFRDQIGAAGMLFLEENVEVTNAIVENEAIRASHEGWKDIGTLDPSEFDKFFKPIHDDRQVDDQTWNTRLASSLEPHTIEVTFDADGDQNLLDMLFGGAEFSPAGLVKSPGSAQEKLELGHYELTGCGRPHHVEVDSEGVAQVVSRDPENPATPGTKDSPRQFGRFPDDGPRNHDVDIAQLTLGETWDDLPDPFAPGTPVEVIGSSYFGFLDDDLLGQKGTVESNPHDNTPEGCVLVGGMTTPDYGSVKVFFPPASLQPVPIDLVAAVERAQKWVDAEGDEHLVMSVN